MEIKEHNLGKYFLHPEYGWLPIRLLPFWNIVRGKALPQPKNYAVITKEEQEKDLFGDSLLAKKE